MIFAFASYKIVRSVSTNGNRIIIEGYTTINAPATFTAANTLNILIDRIAAKHDVPADDVMITNFNVLPDTVD